jgi:hypothetical protein
LKNFPNEKLFKENIIFAVKDNFWGELYSYIFKEKNEMVTAEQASWKLATKERNWVWNIRGLAAV